jgi:PadR family transcriptional regulator, regulatory protein PadR
MRPCVLLLLGEEPTYGYELREKLAPFSLGHWDPGTVYRTLNTMEDDGLVRSTWERSAEGPRRRRYEITPAGSAVLDAWARELCGMRDMIIGFIERYEADQHEHPPPTGVDERSAQNCGLTTMTKTTNTARTPRNMPTPRTVASAAR